MVAGRDHQVNDVGYPVAHGRTVERKPFAWVPTIQRSSVARGCQGQDKRCRCMAATGTCARSICRLVTLHGSRASVDSVQLL